MDWYPFLVVLSLMTLGAVIVFGIWQFFGTKRAQREHHRAAAAVERGARTTDDRPAADLPPDRQPPRPGQHRA